MASLLIKGNEYLEGEVRISGSKNSALCLIAGALAIKRKVILYNIPKISDVFNFIKILQFLNVKCFFIEDSLFIDSTNLIYKDLDIEEVSKFRASYYLIGALLPLYKKVKIKYPGGCDFIKRPIDIHLKMFSDFGASYEENETLEFTFNSYLHNRIYLKNISFGATINAILMGLNCDQEIIIENASNELEIDTFIEFLNKAGKKIIKKNRTITISKGSFHDVEFENIEDRIEIGTFAFIAASLGKIKMYPVNKNHISYLEDVFRKLEITYYYIEDALVVEKSNISRSLILETGEYPLFPSDLQPILTAYLTTIKRIHVLKENIYNKRFSHVEELKKLHASIINEGNTILINGIFSLKGCEVEAHDLRCAAALLVASLNAEGITIIKNIDYIFRGYENIIEKLINIGCSIEVIE